MNTALICVGIFTIIILVSFVFMEREIKRAPEDPNPEER